MRPVNLIPPEERRGTGAPNRTGRAPFVVLAGMIGAVAALTLYVTTGSAVSDREAEIAALEVSERDAQARAEALRPFATFAATREAREATIDSLARSRFDWERVIDELSRVIPDDIWLTELTATASPDTSLQSGSSLSLRSEITGPALELVGCGRDHESVAGLIAAMEDIDGVTRVAATNSSKEAAGGSSGGTAGGTGGADCQTRPSVASFGLVIGFESVPAASSTAPATSGAPTPVAGVTP